jgi:hypothetical protein
VLFGGNDKPSTTTVIAATTVTTSGSTTSAPTTTAGSTTTAGTTTAATTSSTTTTSTTTSTTTTSTTTTTTVAAELDILLEPTFGSVTLISGFTPDPHTHLISSGGSVHATYLGGSCLGWAAPAADYELHYTSGAYTKLRFYFIATDPTKDTALIINDPLTNWSCNDDSYGTRNPTIDYTSPVGGTYDIWVASYSEGAFVAGTLYITEVEGNHP